MSPLSQRSGGNIVSTDDNQNMLARYEYDGFGTLRNERGTSDNTRKFTDADRRTFRDYGFEQQAQILQDAYRFLIEGRRSKSTFKFNEGFKQHTDDYREDYYETLLEEFQEYHRQLLDEESSSSGYLEFN